MPPSSFMTSTPTRSISATTCTAEKSFLYHNDIFSAKNAKPWIFLNVILTILLTIDLTLNHFLSKLLIPELFVSSDLWIIVEKTILILLCLNSLFLMYQSLKPALFSTDFFSKIQLTDRQACLLGLASDQKCFKVVKLKKKVDSNVSRMEKSSLDLSWLFQVRDRRNNHLQQSNIDLSNLSSTKSVLDQSALSPAAFDTMSESYAQRIARMRRARSSSPFVSPAARSIQSREHLKSFLKKFKDRRNNSSFTDEHNVDEDNSLTDSNRVNFSILSNNSESRRFFDDSNISSSSLILSSSANNSYCGSVKIATPDLSRLSAHKYQASPIVTIDECVNMAHNGSTVAMKNDDSTSGSFSTINLPTVIPSSESTQWIKYDVDADKIDLFVYNCKVWLSKTIFKPIAREIDFLNEKLPMHIKIGQASLQSIQQYIFGQQQQQIVSSCWPTLAAMLPYLQMTNEQSLLVERIKSLSQGSCLASYDPYRLNLKSFSENWSDADLVFHFFRVYLTCRCLKIDALKSMEKTPSFSQKYPISFPDTVGNRHCGPILCKPTLQPRFCVKYAGREIHFGEKSLKDDKQDCLDRFCLFKAVVMFLQICRRDFDAKIEGVFMGMSGLNVDWIFDV